MSPTISNLNSKNYAPQNENQRHEAGRPGGGRKANMRRWLKWPVQIGSRWESVHMPGKLFELTMADSNNRSIRLNAIEAAWQFEWHGTALSAASEFYVEEP
jgi:hypothetical protein